MGLFDGAPAPARRHAGPRPISRRCSAGRCCWCSTSRARPRRRRPSRWAARTIRDDVGVAGVILNRVASPRHLALIAPAFERVGIKLFGALGQRCAVRVARAPSRPGAGGRDRRHRPRLDALADAIESRGRSRGRSGAARGTGEARRRGGATHCGRPASASRSRGIGRSPSCIRICSIAGGRPARRSCRSRRWPTKRRTAGADAVWLPGGYPELHAGALAAARALPRRPARARGAVGRRSMASAAATWCWGRGIEDAEGRRHAMAGLLQLETSFAKRRLHIGYRRARLLRRLPAGIGRRGDHGPRIPLCQRAVDRRRAAGRLPRCHRRGRAGSGRAPRLGERHVLPRHRMG